MKGKRLDKLVRITLIVLMFVAAYFIARGGTRLVTSDKLVSGSGEKAAEGEKERLCVVIDAGHGGGKLRK